MKTRCLIALVSTMALGCVGPADSTEVTLTSAGLSVTAESLAWSTRNSQPILTLTARTETNLRTVTLAQGAEVSAQVSRLGTRRFRAVLSQEGLVAALSGAPIDLSIVTTGNRRTLARFRIGASYTGFTGDRAIRVDAAISPVYGTGGAPVRFRSVFEAPANVDPSDAALYSDDVGGRRPIKIDSTRFVWDARFEELVANLDEPTDTMIFEVLDTGETVQKRARFATRVTSIELLNQLPPTEPCVATVRECINNLGTDISNCGSYRQVTQCLAEPRTCALGANVTAFLSDARFSGVGYSLVLTDLDYEPSLESKIIAAGHWVNPAATSIAEVLESTFDARAEVHEVEQQATGTRYTIVTMRNRAGALVGEVFRTRDGLPLATINGANSATASNGLFALCRPQLALGGAQVGEECSESRRCGHRLTCLGQVDGIGRCVPNISPTGTLEACNATTPCAADELICADLDRPDSEGFCAPRWLRGSFNHDDMSLASGVTEVSLTAFGLATVATDVDVFVEIVNAAPSRLRVFLTSPDGTEDLLWDGPTVAAEEPDIDSDDYLELSARANAFPGDESANGTYTFRIENLGAQPAFLSACNLTITSRFD